MFLRSRSFGVLTSSTLKSLGNGSKCLSTKWTGQEVIGSNNKKSGVSDLKPVDMSFAAFESKAKDAIKKDPLVIMHSLLGRKKNWKTVAMVSWHWFHGICILSSRLSLGNSSLDQKESGVCWCPKPRRQPSHSWNELLLTCQGSRPFHQKNEYRKSQFYG